MDLPDDDLALKPTVREPLLSQWVEMEDHPALRAASKIGLTAARISGRRPSGSSFSICSPLAAVLFDMCRIGGFRQLRFCSRFVNFAQEDQVASVASSGLFAEALDRLGPFLNASIVFE